MSDLLTINEFIKEARKQGASFGDSNPKVHLAYLTKLGLLPSATKRKVNGEIQGCYPKDSISTLLEIQKMKEQGMTYSQISKTINNNVNNKVEIYTPTKSVSQTTSLPSIFDRQSSDFILHVRPSNFAYLVLGLVVGLLVSTLNNNGITSISQNRNLSLGQSVEIQNGKDNSDLYLIAVPKQNLDNLDKTNINYLIKN